MSQIGFRHGVDRVKKGKIS
jgi:hypothetical protein